MWRWFGASMSGGLASPLMQAFARATVYRLAAQPTEQ